MKERIERAFRQVQLALGTRFDLTFDEVPPESTSHFETSRSKRGHTDPLAWRIGYHPHLNHSKADPELRADALHELLHVLTFDVYDKATYRRHDKASEEIRLAWEASTYAIERAVAPFVEYALLPWWGRIFTPRPQGGLSS